MICRRCHDHGEVATLGPKFGDRERSSWGPEESQCKNVSEKLFITSMLGVPEAGGICSDFMAMPRGEALGAIGMTSASTTSISDGSHRTKLPSCRASSYFSDTSTEARARSDPGSLSAA